MRKNTTLMLVLAITAMSMATNHDPDNQKDLTKFTDCAEHQEDWKIAQCAAEQRRLGKISETIFRGYLQLTLSKTKSVNSYYSLGLITGVSTKLIIGRIPDPIFDASLSLEMNPQNMYFSKKTIDLDYQIGLPLLLFLTKDESRIQDWQPNYPNPSLPKGRNTQMVAFRDFNANSYEVIEENCQRLKIWLDENGPIPVGITVVLGKQLWCKKVESHEIMVAELEEYTTVEISGATQKNWKTKWSITSSKTVGPVPDSYKSVFQ